MLGPQSLVGLIQGDRGLQSWSLEEEFAVFLPSQPTALQMNLSPGLGVS